MGKDNRILIRGNGVREERDAGVAITPGELLEVAADGDYEPHSTANGNAEARFALEREMTGDDIDTDYVAGDRVVAQILWPGSIVQAFLADGEDVQDGAALASDGAGALQAVAANAATTEAQRDGIVAYAHEDVDNGAGTVRVRIKVRVA